MNFRAGGDYTVPVLLASVMLSRRGGGREGPQEWGIVRSLLSARERFARDSQYARKRCTSSRTLVSEPQD